MSNAFIRRLASNAGQLVLALLNATLILVVVALVLAWALAGRVDHIAQAAISSAAGQVAELTPLADEIGALNDHLVSVRDELAALRELDGSQLSDAARTALATLDTLDDRLADMRAKLAPAVDAVSEDPGILIDRAVQATVLATGRWLTSLGDCEFSEDEVSSRRE